MSASSNPQQPDYQKGFYLVSLGLFLVIFLVFWEMTSDYSEEGLGERMLKVGLFAAMCTLVIVAPILRLIIGQLDPEIFPAIPFLTSFFAFFQLLEFMDLVPAAVISIVFWALYKKWLYGKLRSDNES